MSRDESASYNAYGNYNDQQYNYGGYEQANYGESNDPNQQQQQFYNPNAYMQQQQQQQQQPQQSTQQQSSFAGDSTQTFLNNPMVANIAAEYGNNLMDKGSEELKKNLDKYVSLTQLRYYFAVDNSYVGRKLGILLFPFTQSEWSIQYNSSEPVQPKFDINTPDLYIPAMAYVTYVLIVGYILGLRDVFSPDSLATTASSALALLVLEIFLIYLTLTIMNITTNLSKWDILSFSSYKYLDMIVLLCVGLLGSSTVYYIALAYVSSALAFFLLRTLKLRIEPEVYGMSPSHGKRKLYMIMFYAGFQPLLIWWMTSSFVMSYPS